MFAELIYSKCGATPKPWDTLLVQVPKKFYINLSYILPLVLQMFLPQIGAIWQLYSFKVKQKIHPDNEPILMFHKIKVRNHGS